MCQATIPVCGLYLLCLGLQLTGISKAIETINQLINYWSVKCKKNKKIKKNRKIWFQLFCWCHATFVIMVTISCPQ